MPSFHFDVVVVGAGKHLVKQHEHQQQPFDFSDGSRDAAQFFLRNA